MACPVKTIYRPLIEKDRSLKKFEKSTIQTFGLSVLDKSSGPNFHASLYLLANHHLVAHFKGGGIGGNLYIKKEQSVLPP
jgi:hypothetical protein